MRISVTVAVMLALMPFLGLSGCQKMSDSTSTEQELPDWLTEDASSDDSSDLFGGAMKGSSSQLTLNLQPGTQFPLRKVVEQELTQDSNVGQQSPNRSRLEILFAITVAETQAERTKLQVRYDRVKYQHDIASDHLQFDSLSPPSEIPLAVRAYHAMIGDGFAFWIGADNQIVEVEGFQEFVDRCLRTVPEEYRRSVVLSMEAGSGDSGVANFIDNTIGLLPYGTQPQIGDSWQKQGVISRPIPMHANNIYTLQDLNDEYAVVDIRGTIAPSTTATTIEDGSGVRVNITGGDTVGSCTIFRNTGLPQRSRVDRNIEMTVTAANALEFRQRKRVTTTIESYPSTGSIAVEPPRGSDSKGLPGETPFGQQVTGGSPGNGIQPAHFQANSATGNGTSFSSDPVPQPGGGPVMQVTPPDLKLPLPAQFGGGTQSAQQPPVGGPALR
ncbi:MAG: hypothetical protein KDA80_12715 [Planctomycetaceae bacterium]|nr:hypothetical protein [Planctomycetaceae bacterium]